MRLFDHGQLRKRWRYIALFAEELMLCAARAEVGSLTQSFWVLWDRETQQQWAHTALRPGSREVTLEGSRLEIDGPGLRASLELGDAAPIETTCPSGKSWAWTRKRAGMPVEGVVHQLALVGGRWHLGRGPRPRLEPGRGDQRPAAGQRAGDLGRWRALRATAVPLPRPGRGRPRRRRLPRLRLRVRPRTRRQLPALPLPLPPPLRQLRRHPRRPHARRGTRRDGGARRTLVTHPIFSTLGCVNSRIRRQARYSGFGKSNR